MALNVGSRLGHYDVTALIGEGGMDLVYLAADITRGRMMVVSVPTDPALVLGTPQVFFEGREVDKVSRADDRALVD